MFWYVNEAVHQSRILTMYASMLMLVCGIARTSVLAVIFYEIDLICCYYSNLRHSHKSRVNQWWVLPGENKLKPDSSLRSSIPLFINPVCVPFLDYQTQEPRWLVNEISISKTVSLLLFFFLTVSVPHACFLFLCCSKSAVKMMLKAWRQNAAMSWNELVLCLNTVYACDWSASGPAGEKRSEHTTASGNLALPYFIIKHKDHTGFLLLNKLF